MWPGAEELPAVERAVAETGLEVALFNFDAGDIAAGDRGLLSDPDASGCLPRTTSRSRSSSPRGSAARA